MKILITGGKGMLGRTLQGVLAEHELVIADLPECDITEDVKAVLYQIAGTPKGGTQSLNSLAAQAAGAAQQSAENQQRAANRNTTGRLNSSRRKRSLRALSSRFTPTWIPTTATVSLLCV